MIARALLILVAVATATGCGTQRSGGAGASGLAGIVRISPAAPVCRTGTSCTRPAKRFRLVFSRSGRSVIATTDSNGRYRVELERGRYSVRAARGRKGLQPAFVRVPRGRVAKRDFTYDTGIR